MTIFAEINKQIYILFFLIFKVIESKIQAE